MSKWLQNAYLCQKKAARHEKKNEKQYNKTLIKILKDEKQCIEIKS